nr:hypothetical protein [uncultured Flavobacterium sp.]
MKDRIKSCVFSVLADLLVSYFGRYGFQSRAFGVVDADLPRYHSKAIHVKSQETFITFMVAASFKTARSQRHSRSTHKKFIHT